MYTNSASLLRDAIINALNEFEITVPEFVVEHPGDVSHGDFATNIALSAAKQVGQNPRQFAEALVAKLEAANIPHISTIEIAGPGFINFYLSRDFFTGATAAVVSQGEAWGKNDALAGEVVALEYTSPNLFKPLHVGNLVGNIVGESLARLHEASGATVVRFNYPSDIGLTVAKGVWGLLKTNGDPRDITQLGEAYRVGNSAYEDDIAAKSEIETINTSLYEGTSTELNELRALGVQTSREKLAALLQQLGTTFDHEITESEASTPGLDIVTDNTGGVFARSDGAVVFEGEKVGLHTRVFINSRGLPTYEAKDVGHFTLKNAQEPNWTRSIIITGNEQTEYFKVVFAALRELFPEYNARSMTHIGTGFLTLTTGKMSSRKGNVLTGESLLADMEQAAAKKAATTRTNDVPTLTKQVATAALKYQILRYSVGANIVFDKEKALSFEGDSGPYLQYTHARIISVLIAADEAGISPSTDAAPATPYQLERILYRFPEVVEQSLQSLSPHHLTTYLTELAGAFNAFYAVEKIADVADDNAPYKVMLADAVRQTLQNGLQLLGCEAPERM